MQIDSRWFNRIYVYSTERIEGDTWILGGRSVEVDREGKVVEERSWDNLHVQLPRQESCTLFAAVWRFFTSAISG